MDTWLILYKGIIFIYGIITFIASYTINIGESVIFLLLYLSVNISMYLFINKKFRLWFLIISLLICLFAYFKVNQIFMFFIPLNVIEITNNDKDNRIISILFLIIIVYLFKDSFLTDVILISVISYYVYFMCQIDNYRMTKLTEENDVLKEKNYQLNRTLNKDVQYEAQLKYMSQLEERSKIAQEIHDKIGHTLSGSLMQLEAAKLLIDKDREKSKSIIHNVINVLREGMENIRSTVRTIKPPSEVIGINQIKLLIDEFQLSSGLETSFIFSSELEKISYVNWQIIYNNLKEALTNVMKYSKATKVNISLSILHKLIKLEVKDNGTGTNNIKKGLGLQGMEERTEGAAGKLIIDGSNGFSVITLLPVDKN